MYVVYYIPLLVYTGTVPYSLRYGAGAVGWSIMKGQYNDKRIDII